MFELTRDSWCKMKYTRMRLNKQDTCVAYSRCTTVQKPNLIGNIRRFAINIRHLRLRHTAHFSLFNRNFGFFGHLWRHHAVLSLLSLSLCLSFSVLLMRQILNPKHNHGHSNIYTNATLHTHWHQHRTKSFLESSGRRTRPLDTEADIDPGSLIVAQIENVS